MEAIFSQACSVTDIIGGLVCGIIGLSGGLVSVFLVSVLVGVFLVSIGTLVVVDKVRINLYINNINEFNKYIIAIIK